MSKGNGEAKTIDDHSVEQKLDVLIEGLADLNSRFEEFTQDLIEKLSNLTSENDGFGLLDLDEFDEE